MQFKCWDDCTVAGCPGHTVECRRQSSVMLLHFTFDNGRYTKMISEVEFKAMVEAYNAITQ